MRERFEKYINKKFKSVRNTKEVRELKEEIVNDLMEKSKTIKSKNDDEKYEICIDSLGDLYSLIKEYRKEHNKLEKKIDLPKYKLGEELLNSISHGIGALLSIAALVLCIVKANCGVALFSVLIYGISSIILYLMSCLYHSFKPNNAKRIFRIFDHCSIFLLIAGTYTPFVLLVLPSNIGWFMFVFVWICAIIGIVLNSIDLKKYKKFSMFLYLLMGWCIIFGFKDLWVNMNHFGILLLFVGGILYTLGAVLYGIGKKKRYMHSVFHIFCLFASVCFFLAIFLYAL